MLSRLLVLTGLAHAAATITKEALADKIVNLPGTEKLDVNFNQYSGYLAIPGTTGELTKHMHYWYVESLNHPAVDPLAFWTNGGPGCSGLIGFMTEQGPFKPNADLSLSLNPYAWNKIANMVFIESPVSVGFSYSDIDADKSTGDAQTALDNYNLIQAFLVRFPDLKTNPLYITSESYGGHYIPTLAKQIVDKNTEGVEPAINFKGFAVGNPYTDVYSGTPAMIDTYWGHQLIAKPTYDSYQTDCVLAKRPNVVECAKLEVEIMDEVGDINSYALDYPVCNTESKAKKGRAQRTWFLNALLKSKASASERKLMAVAEVAKYEPCADDWAMQYLNQLSVKKAIHVTPTIPWLQCSYTLDYNMTDSSISTAPIYNYLIDGKHGLDILVYSGDDDSVCGTIGTQEWIWDLGYNATVGRPWQTYEVNKQVAGYLTKWKDQNFAFLTVHGAGHEVPTYKPDVALDLWNQFLNGKLTK